MNTQNSEKHDFFPLTKGIVLHRFNETSLVVQPGFWPYPILLTGLLVWAAGLRKPERSWAQRLGVGLLAMPIALIADVGHAMAHMVSARWAKAPMDVILLYSGMPRTLYENNAVPPKTHIKRSLGGPIFSLLSSAASLLWRRASPAGSLSRDLATLSLASHSFILIGSLVPLPMVDSGIILKWKLVEAGSSEEQADATVHKISFGIGAALLAAGAILGLLRKRKLAGGLLALGGGAGIAAGMGWLK
jgi:hypothetical protein